MINFRGALLWMVCLLLSAVGMKGQSFFPIKIDKKWGLMNADGAIVLPPVYDAIGEFKSFGYAVMQRQGGVGLIGRDGRELIPPKYQDLRVLSPCFVSVLTEEQWIVINLQGSTVLSGGFDRVEVLGNMHLCFQRDRRWGIVDQNGFIIAQPVFDKVEMLDSGFILTRLEGKYGLIGLDGQELLSNRSEEIRVLERNLAVFRENGRWGVCPIPGNNLIPARFDHYSPVDACFVTFYEGPRAFLYSIELGRLVNEGNFDGYYAFGGDYLLAKRNRLLGLVRTSGEVLLGPRYNEIQSFGPGLFRVNYQGKWGLVDLQGSPVLAFEYDYIAPLAGPVCLVRKGSGVGVANQLGRVVLPPSYDRLEFGEGEVRAFSGKELTLFSFDVSGNMREGAPLGNHFTISIGKKDGSRFESQYVMRHFEWFYDPASDRFGLRRLADGKVEIQPAFDYVRVLPEYGWTFVGIKHSGSIDFERTTYRFDMVFGLVDNEAGRVVLPPQLWDLRFADFLAGQPLARCIFNNGRHGLIDRQGAVHLRDCAYIGEFKDGLARISLKGRLSGSLSPGQRGLEELSEYLSRQISPNQMVDFTQYDLEFEQTASLICEDCDWGYVSTTGQQAIGQQYSFASDFVNGVGIVECQGKWGMINDKGQELIPCRYDGVQFLENTDNQIVRIYKREEKYGLIDTLGQMTISLEYDEIGSFRENRLAVKRNGLWGFVDETGLEVVPCRFRAVGNFNEGLAAAKIGNKWGFIDKQGETVIDFKRTRVGNFSGGLAWFFEGARYGYLDRSGRVAIEPRFDKAYDFEGPVARVSKGGKYGLIQPSGKWVVRAKYNKIYPFDRYGLARVSFGDGALRYGIVNHQGKLLNKGGGYLEIRDFREGLAAARTRRGFGFLDTTGILVVADRYSKVSDFSEGLAAVQYKGNCGYIGPDGIPVVPLTYSKCLDFEDGKAVVYNGYKKAGLIDSLGRTLIEPSINRLYTFQNGKGLVKDENCRFYYIAEQVGYYDGYYQQAGSFQHGIAVVQSNGRWGVINQNGMVLVPPKYDKIDEFEDGFAKVRITGFSGLSNLRGELIVQPDYEYISYAGEGLFRVEQGDKIGYFDMEGNWVWGLQD